MPVTDDVPVDPVIVAMTVSYDGTGFHGVAANPGVRTVVGELADALATVLREPVDIVVAGRTDRGVHATGQVMSFTTTSARLDVARLGASLSRMCGPEIAVHGVHIAAEGFDARFSARWRRYHYRVLNTAVADPRRRHVTWQVTEALDLGAMNRAAARLEGEHDFSSFCRRQRPDESLVRVVRRCRWEEGPDGELVLDVVGDSFCQQMVRSIVGFLVDVGRGRRRPDETAAVLDARDRSAAAPVAPPHGLTLVAVGYDDAVAD